MSLCTDFQRRIEGLLSGDSGMDAELQAHLNKCPTCSGLIDLHRNWQPFPDAPSVPVDEAFQRMRNGVLHAIQAQSPTRRTWTAWLPYLAAAAALLIGFASGRESLRSSINPSVTQSEPVLANVSLEPIDNGRVILRYDLINSEERILPAGDPRVGEYFVQAMAPSRSLNQRLETLEAAPKMADPKIKETLIYALRNDRDIAVRLKAGALLSGFAGDTDVRDAFIDVVRHEEATSLRLDAMDYLSRFESDSLGDLIDELQSERDIPLLVRITNTPNEIQ